MSESIQIFVGTQQPLEEVIQMLEQSLGIAFEQKIETTTNQVSYRFTDERTWIWSEKHEYINSRNLPLEEYPYVIDIEAKHSQNSEEDIA